MYVNHNLFFHIDANKDDALDKKEFVERSYGGSKPEGNKAEEEFGQLDVNKNGSLTFEEFKAFLQTHVADGLYDKFPLPIGSYKPDKNTQSVWSPAN